MTYWSQTLRKPQVWLRDFVFTAGLAALFALLGPFGSYDAPLHQRLAENLAYGFVSYPLLWPPARLALRLNERIGLPDVLVIPAALTLLTFPVAAACSIVNRALDSGGGTAPFLTVYGLILTMVLPFGLAYLLIERRLMRPSSAPVAAAGAEPKLLVRLPAHLGREVLALQAEDHYVRVHTPWGSALLLMRLGDAIDELQGVEGERVHRSWWVARRAVASARREGRRMKLTLTNGIEAPVTRESASRLRRAGWA